MRSIRHHQTVLGTKWGWAEDGRLTACSESAGAKQFLVELPQRPQFRMSYDHNIDTNIFVNSLTLDLGGLEVR